MTDGLRRALRAFGHFWWDFLIGDTPELAVATLVIVGLADVLHDLRLVATVALPVLAAVFLLVSTYRGRRRRSDLGEAGPNSSPAETEG
jgi:hypothetical protein